MKKIRICFILIICLNVLKPNVQSQQIWVGESLTEVYFENGKWIHQSEKWSKEIKAIDSLYFVVDEISQEPRYKIGFEELKIDLDTIRLNTNFTTQYFVKPNLLSDNKFKFHSFEYDILSSSGTIKTKYHINRYGVFRKSNHKNETLVEKEIPNEILKNFELLLRKIDIQSMENSKGARNNCDNQEYSFTFWDLSGSSYNYTSMFIRKQLISIKEFVENLEN